MFEELDLHAHALYADLLRTYQPSFDGVGLSFTEKKIQGKTYVYLNFKLGKRFVQKFVGPAGETTNEKIRLEKKAWTKTSDLPQRARLVASFLAAGGTGVSRIEGKILKILERSGFFLAGGMLVGTPAFVALGNNLGVRWKSGARTLDIDIAMDRLALVLPDKKVDLAGLIRESGLGFLEVPSLNPKHPSTSFQLRNQAFHIDVLTPQKGKPSVGPKYLSGFNLYATPLRFLDYLLQQPEVSVIPYEVGIHVLVPQPSRFAFHKLVVAQRRSGHDQIKQKKDVYQAESCIKALLDSRPGDLLEAWEASKAMGKKFHAYVEKGLTMLSDATRGRLKEWLN